MHFALADQIFFPYTVIAVGFERKYLCSFQKNIAFESDNDHWRLDGDRGGLFSDAYIFAAKKKKMRI